MQGKIMKGIAGFYYVHVVEHGVYECKAKGIFRKDNRKPLVGDDVELSILDEEAKLGNITGLLPRKSELIRPAVANVDQAMIIFAMQKPTPNFNLLDRFLIMMEQQELPCIICFNKQDLTQETETERLKTIYENCGYQVIFVSATEDKDVELIEGLLRDKTTTVAGPSGVGKSTIVNRLQQDVCMETGAISEKIERGKHTTRHSELISLGGSSYIMDTPGFSSLSLFDMEKEDLQAFYPEFVPYEVNCRFGGCTHISEPSCGVKDALKDGQISQIRYDNYVLLYNELKNKRKY